jgi:hypothetical protein
MVGDGLVCTVSPVQVTPYVHSSEQERADANRR